MTDKGRHPLWYKDAIIYELHVKAFKDSNGDGIGDFPGLIEKLDYIQDLGVNAIWLLPFYPSPFRDDGYDISDYRGVHPEYGTLRDFRLFVREAHRRGIRVITELVVNHTSDQHPWFQAARRAKPRSAKRNFYVWSDTDTKFPETRIIFTDTEGSNWAWDPVAGAYYWHRFFSHQPDLNHNNPRVVQAVLRLMRFWLDMGVDGLRLDAVPYLCVREGTNNENLPETHAVIKEFRRQIDRYYKDRMLLAEANQWPEDVVAYFGDGDECHMAFHFPLMPRMFMAIRQEDRGPVTEILEHTPAIPDTCQWGLFLRNHDELTLEMVTDEERDYMYQEYAKDRRMRLNVGIRRRLAPLVDNSPRRMELLYSLLFSLPGTPIIYYGDEIGMGDNIYLGDRNGVRTPMQWSADRNAGFSTADPARLYFPLIMDPVYGYQAVNVEAQERDSSSFLHFMKRMIALRRQNKALGRGTLDFLRPRNRRILAYLRRYKGEVILAVANLSRFVQPAEFDLSEFQGWTPVEMIGRTEFPTVGELPYFLTLGPHAFYWFRLEPQAEPIRLGAGGPAEAPPLPHLTLPGDADDLFAPDHRYALENDILAACLPKQRWFRGKARDIASVRVKDWSKLGGGFFVVFAEVSYSDGGTDAYGMPLKIALGEAAKRLAAEAPEALMAWLGTAEGEGVVSDALADKISCCALFAAMTDGRTFPTAQGGRLSAFAVGPAAEEEPGSAPCAFVRRLAAEQSNTSIVLGDAYILKFFRRLEPGPNPDMEIGLYLTECTGFHHIAPVAGGIRYVPAEGEPATAVMLQTFVPNEGDGWTMALEALGGFFRSLPPGAAPPPTPPPALPLRAARAEVPEGLRGRIGPYLEAAALLGKRTGEFHLAVSRERRDRAFIPEPMTPAYLEGLADRFSRQGREALEILNARLQDLAPEAQELAHEVLSMGSTQIQRFQALAGIRPSARLIRCHGDFHLGQVLRTADDFILIDFEGEPLKPLPERREKACPLKDVAGMLRSFSYAAHSGLEAEKTRFPEDAPRLAGWAAAWERTVQGCFLRGYLDTVSGSPLLPPQEEHLELLLEGFLLDKTFYELEYELNNRPAWVHIPLEGLLNTTKRTLRGQG